MFYVNARFLTQKLTGVQRYAIEISRQLRQISSDIQFLAPHNIIHKEVARELNVHCIGHFTDHLWEQVELPLFLRKRKKMLLNLTNTAPLMYNNQIACICDLSFIRCPAWFSKSFSLYYKFLIPKLLNKAKKIITISQFTKSEVEFLLKIPQEKIFIAPTAVTENVVFKDNFIKKHDLENYILAVSSLEPRKNFIKLIESFNKLNTENIKLVICGDQNKIFNSIKLDNSDSRIIFLGRVSDSELAELYKNALCFAYLSLYEGFGIPPLEAMANGCPVLVSNIPSLAETCGNAGYYCNPYDRDDITDKLKQLILNKELRDQLVLSGLKRAKVFCWKTSAEIIYKESISCL